ncbi:MAG: ATP-binding protein, partial [Bacteroidota bacterium]
SPAIFDDTSLQEDFENLLNTFNADQRFTIQFQFDLQGQRPADDVQLNLYRILQEQTKNISKYSEATEIKISVTVTDRLVSMRIADNGIGFDVKHLRKGIGLSNIKRRTEALNGKFILNSAPGKGCEIVVEMPVRNN